MKAKTYKILNYVILGILIFTFFVAMPIRIADRTLDNGMPDPDNPSNFYERWYVTTILYELQVKNYVGTLAYSGLIGLFFGTNKIFYNLNKE